jgi:hypothetical protein
LWLRSAEGSRYLMKKTYWGVMNLSLLACLSLCCVALSGCVERAVWPSARIIDEPAEKDLGFAGRWRDVTAERIWGDGIEDPPQPFDVVMVEPGVYRFVEPTEGTNVTCRAVPLGDDDYALIEAEIPVESENATLRFLVVAKLEGKSLFFRYIQAERLAELMEDEGYAVTVGDGLLYAEIDSKPDELLDCTRKHWRKLIGSTTHCWQREDR